MSGGDGSGGFERRQSQDVERIELGAALSALRLQRGLTGSQLGQLAGMSQAKISKIENGAVAPSVRDVERLATALEVPPEEVRALVGQAENLHGGYAHRRITVGRLTAAQQETGRSESRARVIRAFQPCLVPGLLQTAEYARGVLGRFARLLAGRSGEGDMAVGAAVSARIHRQEVLENRSKRFVIVMSENVLANRLCTPGEFGAQLDRIRSTAALENVTIRILPRDAELAYPPLHGFQLFDDTGVTVDVINATLASRSKADLRVYRAAFEHFYAAATPDIEPILARYSRLYAGLALAALDE
jgi:transcriptional regulator with XRE-family HTH domain